MATASVASGYGSLTITAVSAGTATITVTADDGNGGSVTDSFTVTVDAPYGTPTVASPLDDIDSLEVDDTQQVSLNGVFDDADGDTLTITAESSDDAVATVTVAADYESLTVIAVGGGTATITVTADDGNSGTVSDSFTVTTPLQDVLVRYDFNKDGIIQHSEYLAAVADIGNGVTYQDLVRIRAAWAAGGYQD